MSVHARNKGRRGEYMVRDYFRELGWKSDRVPLSGADPNHKGDVVIEKNGLRLIAEVKFRQNDFKSIYALLNGAKEMHFALGQEMVSMGYEFFTLGFPQEDVEPYFNYEYAEVETPTRAHKKILGMWKLLKGADFLVVKSNNKPLLFIRYR